MEPTEDEKFEAWKRHYAGKYYKDSPYNDPNYVRPKGKVKQCNTPKTS